MKVSLIILFFLFFLPVSINAEEKISDSNQYFNELIEGLCSTGDCREKPDPDDPEMAKEIMFRAIFLAYLDNSKTMDKLKRSYKVEKYDAFATLPLVQKALCKYFGLDFSQNKNLQDAIKQYGVKGGKQVYKLPPSDPGMVAMNVQKTELQEDGIMLASGIDDEDETPFKAFFKKTECGGESCWTLLKIEK